MPTIIPITDFATPELDIYTRLTENQLLNRADPANALFVAESPLVIGRALDAGCTPVSFLMETKHVNGKGAEILARCPADIPVYAAELEVLTQLTGFHLTRGMLCAMRRPPLPTVEEICAKSRRIAVLENVMNPTNIGAIFRSAAALGMDAVLLTASDVDASAIGGYDAVALGCPAMGSEVLEDMEFEPMFDGCKSSLKGKRVALFGSYGWGGGEWMHNWERDCRSSGIQLACDSVICSEAPDDAALAACQALGKALVD